MGERKNYNWEGKDLDLIDIFPITYRGDRGVLYRLNTGEWIVPKGTKCYTWTSGWIKDHLNPSDKYYKLRKGNVGEYVMEESVIVSSANIACQHVLGRSTNAPAFLQLDEKETE